MVLLFTLPAAPAEKTHTTIAEEVRALMTAQALSEKDALKQVARTRGIGKSEAYREFQRTR